ncbi:MAG: hypothetical protein ABIH72_05000 [archaeon]
MIKMPICKKCGKLLKIFREGEKIIGKCICGFEKEVSMTFNDNIIKKTEKGKGVIDKKKDFSGFPHTCKKCGHSFSDVTDMGTFYGDEANVYLFTCKKCGYIERQADGTGNK